MARFYWNDFEIARLYRTAKNKEEEIQILAELNDVTTAEMAWKLWELGCIEKQPPRPRERVEKTERKAHGDEELSNNKNAVYARKQRDEWRENGCCIWCGKVAAKNRVVCKWCLEKSRLRGKAKREKQKRKGDNAKNESET